jgi:2-succinyl-5-enolpyruvyl-6-hydroxy-3-cyclohexene-1-carboxylate synthase
MTTGDHTRDTGAANLAFARALLAELHACGVAAAVVCPGSRSTPLALAVAWQDGLAHSVHLDERSAAFHALGFAKACGRPVVLVCTSGTAGANFLPAIAEASHARVPLVVLTADRPPELRTWGAAQTMEQRTLYAGFTRWSEEAPCPSEGGGGLRYAKALARRAVAEATGPAPGPVHLNLPFREPLVPERVERTELPAATARLAPVPQPRPLDPGLGASADQLRAVARGVLVFGPDAWDPSLAASAARLATALGWPVLADPASGLRAGPELQQALISGADLLLREPAAASALRPDLVLRFGGLPTSKAISRWLDSHAQADVWLVDPAAACRDPQHRASRVLRAGAADLAASLAGSGPPPDGTDAWRRLWERGDAVVRAALDELLPREARLLGPQVARALWSALPEGAALYVANSMPIREIDAFAGRRPAPLRVLANRGVNGIDGQVSSALGAAEALGRPTVLWCGDLALLHDLAGLLAGRLHEADLTIVVTNDDGGGIFEYLAVASAVPRTVFEPMFAVPHGLDLSALAPALGWQTARVREADHFAAALREALGGGRHLIEVPVDRAANTAFHGLVQEATAGRLRREFGG